MCDRLQMHNRDFKGTEKCIEEDGKDAFEDAIKQWENKYFLI